MNNPSHPNASVRSAGQPPSAPGLSIADIYYTLFRHKWKIILIFLAGMVGAAGFYKLNPPLYQSEARILIRFILENRSATPGLPSNGNADAQIRSPDSAGNNIINSEIEILTSFDLAGQVADAVGPEKILANTGGVKGDGLDRARAAGAVHGGLQVEVPGRSSVVRIIFSHPDPTVVQPVLTALVDAYLTRHKEIHQGTGVMDDFFLRQADQLRTRLAQTEEELKKLRAEAQVVSVDDSLQGYTAQIARIQDELLTAEAELAGRRATFDALNKSVSTNAVEGTNAAAATTETSVPTDVMTRYRSVLVELETLRRQRSELRLRYQDEYFLVRNVNTQITETEATKLKLETENPGLLRLGGTVASSTATTGMPDLQSEALQVNALQARIKVLMAQLVKVRQDAGRVAEVQPAIIQLERSREADEANLRSYVTRLELARMDETLSAGKVKNIDTIQAPTPPARDTKKLMKPLMMILAFGSFGGFAWGFVSDRFLSQTIKRVVDIERQLPVPLFISVPDMGWQNGSRLLKFGRKDSPSVNEQLEVAIPETGEGSSVVAPWDAKHKLRPYYEGLRDRLITYFEVREMRHKPKMVAVTGCARGAGVTTMAAGLAAALSETGDGKVLLVDMNVERGAAHPFFQGKPGVALADALDDATRDPAFVQDNLYLVSAQELPKNRQLPTVLPKRFANLVPKMKASDYDYIIFDMPPVTQTSVTARLSGFMDMVLLVVESEKTGQDILKRTHGLLNESRPNMAAILNKHRSYVPNKFAQEL